MVKSATPDAPAGAPVKTRPRKAAKARPKLSAAECRALANADARYKKAKRAFLAAESQRKLLIDKAEPKVELGKWVAAGGWAIKITMQNSGGRFKLSEYLKQYNLTGHMRPFVSEGKDSPRLAVQADKVAPEPAKP